MSLYESEKIVFFKKTGMWYVQERCYISGAIAPTTFIISWMN